MPLVTYIEKSGTRREIDVPLGRTLMEGGRDANVQGIIGECGGGCSCATCHIHIAPEWVDRLPALVEMERDMLDFADNLDPARSRLGCQLRVTAAFEGLEVAVATE